MTETPRISSGALIEEFARRLRENRRNLLRTLALTDDELATLEAHRAGAAPEDAATETVGVILSRLETRHRHELDEIEDALARLEHGTFGLCESCGRAIPLARLRAMPATRHCLDCQKKSETP
ncbi:MAG TPA: TraR/DksA C4-type zinc finger protein [Methylomirabilota bacterium]|jgi:DnaK suppressor protein|nr:TraR/DksA C4-type zinc finger protein [Methylomirabilota bacterium]